MIEIDEHSTGNAMHARLTALYPICRSITGNGVRQTLADLQKTIPLEIREVKSGTPVFDWNVPSEWNIRDAWIKDAAGERVVDFNQSNLHVVNYSMPIHATMSLSELKGHLHSLPEQPDAIPYRTSYYKQDWGFCISYNAMQRLKEGNYEVCIDSTLQPGFLTYGEFYIPGELTDEVLFSAHICHPSLANDNLSGIVVAVALAAGLAATSGHRYSYRFLFIPGTIGAITWLAHNESVVERIKHGMVLSGLGDAGPVRYKRSRLGNATVDRAAALVLTHLGQPHTVQDFSPYGYDERQFCSPGFNLPVGCFSRSPFGTYSQYHTSADNLDFVKPESLAESLRILRKIVAVLEGDGLYRNTQPKCEPQLGKRGLYDERGSTSDTMAMLWVLNFSDGEHTLMDIAERASFNFDSIRNVATILESNGLLKRQS